MRAIAVILVILGVSCGRVFGASASGGSGMSERIALDRCEIVMGDEPAYVRLGVEDVRAYLQEITGTRPALHLSSEDAGRAGALIVVGKEALREMPGAPDLDLPTDPQSYVLRAYSGKQPIIIVAGNDPQGTKYALVDLLRAIRFEGREAWIPGDLNVTDRPHFGLRGMYAHLHWQYNHPYALRSWSLQDWKRYVDMLAYMKVNLFQIWTMAAICPNPLNSGDEAYLEKYHEVVKYAREMRGMEVWPGECANNIAESDFGAPIEEREYFQVEVLKNPADPKQFQQIMDNRANMYRLIDNGDGYWIIDSDPGRWKGSPSSELADIFTGNRELIDRYAKKGRDAKLVYWVWQGWGSGTPGENWRATIEGIRDKVREPWWLTPCNADHLALVSEMGYLRKSVFFPYGHIEPEPSNPLTHVKFADLAETVSLAERHPGLAGIMGNAQTPFVQLPNIFYLAECAWNSETTKLSDEEVLRRLARLVFPAVENELTEGWLALSAGGSDRALKIGRKLESLAAQDGLGLPGPGGRFIFPDPKIIVRDLALLLKMHGNAEKVRELVDAVGARGSAELQDAVVAYLSAVLDWQRRTGWHGCRVDGVDFNGGGTLLHGRDFVTVYQAVRSYLGQDAVRMQSWAASVESRLREAGFSDSMSYRAALETIAEPGVRRPDGRR